MQDLYKKKYLKYKNKYINLKQIGNAGNDITYFNNSLIYDDIIDKKIFEPFPLSIKIHIYCLFVNFMMHKNLNILLYVQPLPNMAKIIEDNLKIEQIEYDENDKNNIIAVTQPPGRDGFPTTRNNGFKIEFEKIYELYNYEIPIEFRGTGDNYLTNTGYCILPTTSEEIKLFYDDVKKKFCNIDIFKKDDFILELQNWIITLNEGDVPLTNDNFKSIISDEISSMTYNQKNIETLEIINVLHFLIRSYFLNLPKEKKIKLVQYYIDFVSLLIDDVRYCIPGAPTNSYTAIKLINPNGEIKFNNIEMIIYNVYISKVCNYHIGIMRNPRMFILNYFEKKFLRFNNELKEFKDLIDENL